MADSIDIKIYYEDTDCGGVVYYGKYLGFLEKGRTEYLEKRGARIPDLIRRGIHFLVAHVDIRYHSPARYADLITLFTEIEETRFASITFNHRITLKNSDTLIASARVKLACVGANMKPIRMAKEIVDSLNERA